MAKRRRTPAELAALLGLIGSFTGKETETDLAADHSAQVKLRLRAKLERQSLGSTAPRRKTP
jgi:hypothetical protein